METEINLWGIIPGMEASEQIPDVDDTGPWTNAQVAAHLGVNRVTLSRLRSGAKRPSITLMQTIQDRLGWRFHDQAKAMGRTKEPFAYALALQDFLLANYHVPTTTIKGLAERSKR